jgi:hypothetical protein
MLNISYAASGADTWNALYAYRFMIHTVSRYLIDILGPINVAFITGSQFEWTNAFLTDALLSMNIYSDIVTEENEIHPVIQSGNIYV